jgi:hypothetical protein
LQLLGLGPALAKAVPAVQDVFVSWGDGELPPAALWYGFVGASEFSEGLWRVALDYSFSAINIGFGVFIVWLRPRDWTTRLLGLALVGTGNVFNFQAHGVLFFISDSLSGIHLGIHAVSGATYVHALLIFPNGKLIPRWSVGLIGAVYLLMAYAIIFIVIPAGMGDAFFEGSPGEVYSSVISLDTVYFVVFFGLLIPIIGLTSQLYRYRVIYTPQERQQTKLVVWSIAVSFGAGILFILLAGLLNASQWANLGVEAAFEDLEELVFVYFPLMFAIVPISLVIAILRYRLWDIDHLVNRTLVFGMLTAMLAATYFGGVILLQLAFRAVTDQGSGVAIVISTLTIVALFQPLRRRIQALIDRRFYRRRYDAAQALAAFSATIRDEVNLDRVSEALISVVEETMQPAHVSLSLRRVSGSAGQVSSDNPRPPDVRPS